MVAAAPHVPVDPPRVATAADAGTLAQLLDTFNREFATPTPGPDVLQRRLTPLLADGSMFAVLTGHPAVAFALLSMRSTVWYDGPVVVLDELYVAPHLRGHGLGTALLHAVEAEVQRRDGQAVEINVDGDDVDARRFYERHGYRNSEPGEDEPLLYYYRELTPVT